MIRAASAPSPRRGGPPRLLRGPLAPRGPRPDRAPPPPRHSTLLLVLDALAAGVNPRTGRNALFRFDRRLGPALRGRRGEIQDLYFMPERFLPALEAAALLEVGERLAATVGYVRAGLVPAACALAAVDDEAALRARIRTAVRSNDLEAAELLGEWWRAWGLFFPVAFARAEWARQSYGRRPLWRIRCPHCGRRHTHGPMEGHRGAHCVIRPQPEGYHILAPLVGLDGKRKRTHIAGLPADPVGPFRLVHQYFSGPFERN